MIQPVLPTLPEATAAGQAPHTVQSGAPKDSRQKPDPDRFEREFRKAEQKPTQASPKPARDSSEARAHGKPQEKQEASVGAGGTSAEEPSKIVDDAPKPDAVVSPQVVAFDVGPDDWDAGDTEIQPFEDVVPDEMGLVLPVVLLDAPASTYQVGQAVAVDVLEASTLVETAKAPPKETTDSILSTAARAPVPIIGDLGPTEVMPDSNAVQLSVDMPMTAATSEQPPPLPHSATPADAAVISTFVVEEDIQFKISSVDWEEGADFVPRNSPGAKSHIEAGLDAAVAVPLVQSKGQSRVLSAADLDEDAAASLSDAEGADTVDIFSASEVTVTKATASVILQSPMEAAFSLRARGGGDASSLDFAGEEQDAHDPVVVRVAEQLQANGARQSLSATMPRVDASVVMSQIGAAVHRNGAGQVEVALNPPELGRLRISMDHRETGIVVSISADRPETMDLIRRHVDQLEREFLELGYQSATFNFSSGDETKDQGTTAERDGSLIGDFAPGDAHMMSETRPRSILQATLLGPAQLDIRL